MGKHRRKQKRTRRYDQTALAHRAEPTFRRIPQPRRDIDPSLAWYVVRAGVKAERKAELGLQRAGFDTFLPYCIEERMRRGKRYDVTRGLLVRYFFVGLDPKTLRFDLVRETDGVEQILSVDGAPAFVRHAFLQAFANRVTGEEAIGSHPPPSPFKVGAVAKVVDGPFTAHDIVVDEVTPQGSVVGTVHILGRPTPVVFDAAQLKAA